MANQDMGKTMGNRACDWVRARLPLLVHNCEGDQTEGDGEEGDLTIEDRQAIERHLGDCTSCRRHQSHPRSGTGRTRCGRSPNAGRDRCSITLARAGAPDRKPRCTACLHAGCGPRADSPTNGPGLGECSVAGGRSAWPGHVTAWERHSLAENNRVRNPDVGLAWFWVSASAAAISVALIGLPALRRQWVEAQSTIVANSAPLADPVVPTLPLDESSPEVEDKNDDGEVTTSHLVEADPVRAGEAPRSGTDGTLAPKQSPHSRFGYDLEHGTSTPLDVRESKPVY